MPLELVCRLPIEPEGDRAANVTEWHLHNTLYEMEMIFPLFIKECGRGLLVTTVGWGKEGHSFQPLHGVPTDEGPLGIEL